MKILVHAFFLAAAVASAFVSSHRNAHPTIQREWIPQFGPPIGCSFVELIPLSVFITNLPNEVLFSLEQSPDTFQTECQLISTAK